MKRILIVLCAVLLALALLGGCAGLTAEAQRTAVPKDLLEEDTDAMGNTVHAVEGGLTIVSTAPSATEILFALGCGDNIVGVDINSTYPPETQGIAVVGDFNGFDIEKVIALEPTVVFAGNGLQHADIAALEDAGLYVVAAEATYYEDIAKSITLIGSVVGREEEAAALNAQIAATQQTVKEKAARLKYAPTVYYVMGIGEYGNWTSGKGSFINTLIETAGGVCVTADTDREWLEYPVEDLVVSDPDILIVSAWVREDDLKAETGYKDLTAVGQGHYLFVDPEITERPGPRIGEALLLISDYIAGFGG